MGGGGAGGGVWAGGGGGAAAANWEPQFLQNLALSGFSMPHVGQNIMTSLVDREVWKDGLILSGLCEEIKWYLL
jgi:hypothetical protein